MSPLSIFQPCMENSAPPPALVPLLTLLSPCSFNIVSSSLRLPTSPLHFSLPCRLPILPLFRPHHIPGNDPSTTPCRYGCCQLPKRVISSFTAIFDALPAPFISPGWHARRASPASSTYAAAAAALKQVGPNTPKAAPHTKRPGLHAAKKVGSMTGRLLRNAAGVHAARLGRMSPLNSLA